MVENISLVVLTYDWKYLCYTIIPDTGVVSISYMEIIFFPTLNFQNAYYFHVFQDMKDTKSLQNCGRIIKLFRFL